MWYSFCLLEKLKCYCGNKGLLSVLMSFNCFSLFFPDVLSSHFRVTLGFPESKERSGSKETRYITTATGKHIVVNVLYLTITCITLNVTFLHNIKNMFSALCSKLSTMTNPAVWREPLCKKHLPVCISKIMTDQCCVTEEILGRTCVSNVWVFTDQIPLCFFTSELCLNVCLSLHVSCLHWTGRTGSSRVTRHPRETRTTG